jgi:hypothetical protein
VSGIEHGVEVVQRVDEGDVVLLGRLDHDVDVEGRPGHAVGIGREPADEDETDLRATNVARIAAGLNSVAGRATGIATECVPSIRHPATHVLR